MTVKQIGKSIYNKCWGEENFEFRFLLAVQNILTFKLSAKKFRSDIGQKIKQKRDRCYPIPKCGLIINYLK